MIHVLKCEGPFLNYVTYKLVFLTLTSDLL